MKRVFFSDEPHIAPTVGVGDFGKEAAVDQIYLAGPPLPLVPSMSFYPDFFLILSRFYLDFIQSLSRFYPDFL